MMPAANLAAWGAAQPAFSPTIPASRTVPGPVTAGGVVRQTTDNSRTVYSPTFNGTDAAQQQRLFEQWMEQRERRRNNERSTRDEG